MITLYNEDSFSAMDRIESNSVDMIFVDPPYFLSSGSFTCKAGRAASVDKGKWDRISCLDEKIEFHKAWLVQCRRVLKINGSMWVCGTYHNIYLCGFLMQRLGYEILNDICWYKPDAPPNLSCKRFTATHETLIWAKKHKASGFTFNYEYTKSIQDHINKEGKQTRSVWSITRARKSEIVYGRHPTQKPEELLERVILSTTNKGDLILDPFMGSGTTGVVAIKHGRKFIGVELDKQFYEVAKKRIAEGGKQCQHHEKVNQEASL